MLWTKSISINLALLLCAVVLSACAQVTPVVPSATEAEPAGEAAQKPDTDEADSDAMPTIASFVEDSAAVPGFFDLYQEKKNGSVYLRIPVDQLGQELIYTATVTDGVVETGLFRGQYRDNKILTVRRHLDRTEVVPPHTRFYFDPERPVSRAPDANARASALAGLDSGSPATTDNAEESTEPSAVLVDFTPVLLSENLTQIKPAKKPDAKPGESLTLGKFTKDRSKIVRLASYPDNSLVHTNLVYEVAAPMSSGGDDVTDARGSHAIVKRSYIPRPVDGCEARLEE